MEGDQFDSEDGFLRSLSPTVSASYKISLFVSYGFSLISINICTFISLAVFILFYCSNIYITYPIWLGDSET